MEDENGAYEPDEPGPEDEGRHLDDHESAAIRQDLRDLERFQVTFGADGFRGVSVYCHDCAEEHFYPWQMLRENLRTLLETGETPVHEPAFAPDPDQYVPWEYARGYVDALGDVGVPLRVELDACPRCQLRLDRAEANFCPRCGSPLLRERLRATLARHGIDEDDIELILREGGLPG